MRLMAFFLLMSEATIIVAEYKKHRVALDTQKAESKLIDLNRCIKSKNKQLLYIYKY